MGSMMAMIGLGGAGAAGAGAAGAAAGATGAVASGAAGGSLLSNLGLGLQLGKAGLGIASSISESIQNKKWNKFEIKQSKADAAARLKLAEFDAKQQREKTMYEANKLMAATSVNSAANGVVVGSDTSSQVVGDLIAAGEYDAQMTMFNAQDAYKRQLQQIKYNQLKNKKNNLISWLDTGGSIMESIGGGLAAFRAWQTAGDTTTAPSLSLNGSSTLAGGSK